MTPFTNRAPQAAPLFFTRIYLQEKLKTIKLVLPVEIFYWINGIAGQYAALDWLMRLIYVAAVPVLGSVLVAWIFLTPRSWMPTKAPSRQRLLMASSLAILSVIISIIGVHAFQQFALDGGILSRRPFITHFVTTLVMEPNNNSFPCFEVMFAFALATLLWAARPRVGIGAWLLAGLLAFSRLYCGSNFTIDVVIGGIWGSALAGGALATCGIGLTFPLIDRTQWRWRVYFQGAASMGVMVLVLLYVFGLARRTPTHFPHLFTWLHRANAAPVTSLKSTFEKTNSTVQPGRKLLLATKSARLDGHLPRAERYLQKVLQRHSSIALIGVNVAEVKVGPVAYRSAAIRFKVNGHGNAERKRVSQVAATLVKTAFHADARINHIDILGIKMQLPPQDKRPLYTQGGIPVFTASIDRDSLILRGERAWLNRPQTDPGLWLRARSLLYFDPQVLPSKEVFPVKEFLKKSK